MFSKLFGSKPIIPKLPVWIDASTESVVQGLQAWDMYDFCHCTPIAVTSLGDIFLANASQNVSFLDRMSGEVQNLKIPQSQLQKFINNSPEWVEENMKLWALDLAEEAGLALGNNECFDFILPLALGGEIAPDNIQSIHIEMALDISGQLFSQAVSAS